VATPHKRTPARRPVPVTPPSSPREQDERPSGTRPAGCPPLLLQPSGRPAEATGSPIRADVRVGSGQARAPGGHPSDRSGSCGHPARPSPGRPIRLHQHSGSGPQPRNGRVGGTIAGSAEVTARSQLPTPVQPHRPRGHPRPSGASTQGADHARPSRQPAEATAVSTALPHSSGQAAGTGRVRNAWNRGHSSHQATLDSWPCPRATDGQSADGSGSLQLPLLLLKAGLRAAAYSGRPRPPQPATQQE
jgi:hypothetical protein